MKVDSPVPIIRMARQPNMVRFSPTTCITISATSTSTSEKPDWILSLLVRDIRNPRC